MQWKKFELHGNQEASLCIFVSLKGKLLYPLCCIFLLCECIVRFTWLGAGVLKDGVLDTVDIVKESRTANCLAGSFSHGRP